MIDLTGGQQGINDRVAGVQRVALTLRLRQQGNCCTGHRESIQCTLR